jgi:hypothetical protein
MRWRYPVSEFTASLMSGAEPSSLDRHWLESVQSTLGKGHRKSGYSHLTSWIRTSPEAAGGRSVGRVTRMMFLLNRVIKARMSAWAMGSVPSYLLGTT